MTRDVAVRTGVPVRWRCPAGPAVGCATDYPYRVHDRTPRRGVFARAPKKPFLGFFMTETCLTLLPLPTPTTDDPRSQVRARPRKHAALTILYPRSPSSALRTSAKPAGLKTVACPAQSGAKPAGLKTVACPAQSGPHCNQPSVPASHRHAQPRTTGCPTPRRSSRRLSEQQRAETAAASSSNSSEKQQQRAATAASSSSEQQQRAAAASSSSEQQQQRAEAASSSSDRSNSSELYIPPTRRACISIPAIS